MTILWNRLKVTGLLIFSGWLGAVQAQTLKQTYAFAQQQLESRNYEQATHTFHRVLYFTEDTFTFASYRGLGRCYFELGNYQEAHHYYKLASFTTDHNAAKHELVFKQTLCLLLQQDYYFALSELLQLPDSLPPDVQARKTFYLGIIRFGRHEFEQAEALFLKLISDTARQARSELTALFEKNRKIDRLNPKVAKIMSMILPGAGQLYAGDLKNGLNSLLLTTGLIAIGINTAFNLTVIDAVVSITPWYMRYYVGGFQKAEVIAQRKVLRKRKKVYQEILDTLHTHIHTPAD